MFEKLDKCPLCGSTKSTGILICKDYTSTEENFVIEACEKCNFKYTNPRPTEETIYRYYQSNKYISHSDTNKGLINKAYHLVKQKAITDKIRLINQNQKKGKILDIGCGTGSFLEACKKNGWEVAGVEPDLSARNKAEARIESKIKETIFQIERNNYFDVITMWHVLEHIHKLHETIIHLKKLLSINGILVIAVPNNNSYDANLYKEYWAAYDVPRHLYHFTKETVIQLIENFGFKMKAISPMKFDAFYISLLSYRYKHNNVNYVQAIFEGYKSNKWASKNKDNYSSLIYIFNS